MTGGYQEGRPISLLQEDFHIYIDGRQFRIPKGVTTDLGSIPRLFWSLYLPSDPDSVAAYLLHDMGYVAELWPREYSDKLLLSTMEYLGSKGKWLKYMAVRIGGSATYKNHSENGIRFIRRLMNIDSMKRPLWKAGEFDLPTECRVAIESDE